MGLNRVFADKLSHTLYPNLPCRSTTGIAGPRGTQTSSLLFGGREANWCVDDAVSDLLGGLEFGFLVHGVEGEERSTSLVAQHRRPTFILVPGFLQSHGK